MTVELESYPNRIREVRKSKGVTQAQLGARVGISAIHVGHVELGRRNLTLDLMEKIADALGASPNELLNSRVTGPVDKQSADKRLTISTANHITTLTLNRPDAMNPLGADGDGDAFAAACDAINENPDVRCVILTGAGRAFSAGGDIKAMRDKTGNFGGNPVSVANGYRDNIHKVLRALYGLRVPLIAAVNGPAIGLGCDLACLADIRIASERAKFGVTFLKLGIIPGDGGTWILPRVIGEARAAELFYTGDVIDAQTALDWGLVSRVVEADTLMEAARSMAAKIAAMPPHALRQTKNLLRQGRSITYDTALELAANTQALMHHTDDHAEGVAALIEKRTPDFKGS